MNLKKCKALRKVAKELMANNMTTKWLIRRNTGVVLVNPDCYRGHYRLLKRVNRP